MEKDLLTIRVSSELSPIETGVLKEYLDDGAIIDAEIEFGDSDIGISPISSPGNLSLEGLVIWLEKTLATLNKIRSVAEEATKKVKQKIQ